MCDVYNETYRPEAVAAEHLDFKRETVFMMKLCQMFKGAFICLPAVVFNLVHRGLHYFAFIFVFVTCVLGDFIFFFSESLFSPISGF